MARPKDDEATLHAKIRSLQAMLSATRRERDMALGCAEEVINKIGGCTCGAIDKAKESLNANRAAQSAAAAGSAGAAGTGV